MRKVITTLVLIGATSVAAGVAFAAGPSAVLTGLLTDQAISADPAIADPAIERLRAAGLAGLEELLTLLPPVDATVQKDAKSSIAIPQPAAVDNLRTARIKSAVDRVAGQRDASVSQLYWYTDLGQARRAAAESGKPILSLHLLGKLTDDRSRANSRFFRTTVYANQEMAAWLGEHFVLHWQSVRPVPHISIDMGDGRRIERTITGNSIHYVLDDQGRVIDALPGLYGAKAFRRELENAERLARECSRLSDAARLERLQAYHTSAAITLTNKLATALGIAGMSNDDATAVAKAPTDKITDELWSQIANQFFDDTQIDEASARLILRDKPGAVRAGALAITKRKVENPMLRVLTAIRRTIAEDTAQNELVLHRQIHEALVREALPVAELNKWVYAKVFLTPLDDPWMGLLPDADYAALADNGLVVEQPAVEK